MTTTSRETVARDGDAIAAARRLRRQSQADLAELLTEVTGEEWSRMMVAKLERGRKALSPDILRALAKVQGMPYRWYLDGPESVARTDSINPGEFKRRLLGRISPGQRLFDGVPVAA